MTKRRKGSGTSRQPIKKKFKYAIINGKRIEINKVGESIKILGDKVIVK